MNKDEIKAQAFIDEYKELCKKHNLVFSPAPSWRFSKDGNDFRLVINLQVVKKEQ